MGRATIRTSGRRFWTRMRSRVSGRTASSTRLPARSFAATFWSAEIAKIRPSCTAVSWDAIPTRTLCWSGWDLCRQRDVGAPPMESHADEDRLVAAENELARLREQLDRANQKAKSLKEELDGFVYAASHDLKAPLRSIGSYSQLLIRTSGEGGDCADYARFILEGVHDAVVLVDKLLNLSRAG